MSFSNQIPPAGEFQATLDELILTSYLGVVGLDAMIEIKSQDIQKKNALLQGREVNEITFLEMSELLGVFQNICEMTELRDRLQNEFNRASARKFQKG